MCDICTHSKFVHFFLNLIFFFCRQEDDEKDSDHNDDDDDEDGSSETSTDSEACSTARMIVSADHENLAETDHQTETRIVRPPTPMLPPPELADGPAAVDDGDPSGELVRLRARCRKLERSLQQLVNTELWARNRQIGKLEQHRYATQITDAAALQRERLQSAAAKVVQEPRPRSAAATSAITPTSATTSTSASAPTKGILVTKSPPESPPVATTTPPSVLPDYSEVNFFYSCDEEEDNDDEEEDENDDQGKSSDSSSSSTSLPTTPGKDPATPSPAVRKSAPPMATSTPVREQKRHCRRHHRQSPPERGVAEASSSTESVPAAAGGISDGGSASETTSRRRRRAVGGGPGSHRRRRCRPRRCSTCGRCGGEDRESPPVVGFSNGMTDAQIQCDGVGAAENGGGSDANDQLVSLHRELEARRRENCRLYDMLLSLQRGRREEEGGPSSPADSDRDDGSPEPYRRAARAVRGRITDLLPPLLSSGPAGNHAQQPPPDDGEQTLLRQQQRQLQLLARLRERIVAYERQELQLAGGRSRGEADGVASTDPENAVEHMDRAALVNVALPRAVDRLRRALVPLMRHRSPEEPDAELSGHIL